MERNWDDIDEQASREGEAIKRLAYYTPTRPNSSTGNKAPKRTFGTDLCHRVENLPFKSYKRHLRMGDLKIL